MPAARREARVPNKQFARRTLSGLLEVSSDRFSGKLTRSPPEAPGSWNLPPQRTHLGCFFGQVVSSDRSPASLKFAQTCAVPESWRPEKSAFRVEESPFLESARPGGGVAPDLPVSRTGQTDRNGRGFGVLLCCSPRIPGGFTLASDGTLGGLGRSLELPMQMVRGALGSLRVQGGLGLRGFLRVSGFKFRVISVSACFSVLDTAGPDQRCNAARSGEENADRFAVRQKAAQPNPKP